MPKEDQDKLLNESEAKDKSRKRRRGPYRKARVEVTSSHRD